MPTYRKLTLASMTGSQGTTTTTRAAGAVVKTADGTQVVVEDVQVNDVICVSDVLGFQRVTANEEVVE